MASDTLMYSDAVELSPVVEQAWQLILYDLILKLHWRVYQRGTSGMCWQPQLECMFETNTSAMSGVYMPRDAVVGRPHVTFVSVRLGRLPRRQSLETMVMMRGAASTELSKLFRQPANMHSARLIKVLYVIHAIVDNC